MRQAIVLVADQHASCILGAGSLTDLSDYIRVIRGLARRSLILAPHEDETTLTTLLLLHLRQIISGNDDFMLVYGSLRCLVMKSNYLSNLSDSPLGRFVKIQILR